MANYIFYHGPITAVGAHNFETECLRLIKEGAEDVFFCISSGGGDVASGLGMYDFIKMLPLKVYTHAFGLCGSIAVSAYLAGEHRTCSSSTVFTLHAAKFVEGPLAGQISEGSTRSIYRPFKSDLKWDDARIAEFFGRLEETYFDAREAIDLGIVIAETDLRCEKTDQIVLLQT